MTLAKRFTIDLQVCSVYMHHQFPIHTHTHLSTCTQADPKRVKKALPKILKTMKPDDRVMILGITRAPFGERLSY